MKITRCALVLVIIALFSVLDVQAQKNPVRDADRSFKSETFNEAKELYKKAFPKIRNKDEKARVLYQIGECYRIMQDPIQAEVWYKKAIALEDKEPLAHLYLADAIRRQGKYDEAVVEYKKFMEMANPEDKILGEKGLEACEQAVAWAKKPSRYQVNPEPLLNSKYYDFSPTFADNKFESILFTSSRPSAGGDVIDETYGESFSDIYWSERDEKGKWSVPTPLNPEINTEANEGSASLDEKYKMMVFTRCELQKKKVKGCKIYQSRRQGKNWAEPELVDLGSDDTATVGHPILLDKGQTIIFSSDMQGGYGGKDLWYATYDKKNRRWNTPINLGAEVNTPRDEMFPFVRYDGKLYFSSNGHIGMGGLDIFEAEKLSEFKWGNVQNMKAPINSSANDFALVFEGERNRGFFTTSRLGGKGGDDIYSFYMPPIIFKLQGTITDVDTEEKLPGATVKLIGTDGSSVETKTDELGEYLFDVTEDGKDRYIKENTSYTIEVSGKDLPNGKSYLKSQGQETTVGLEVSTGFVHDFALQCSNCGEIRMPLVLYDLGKWDLQVNETVNSKDSLDYLYNILTENPTLVIELAAHTDSRGSSKSNQILSQKRAESCVNYLIEKGINPARMVPVGYGESKLKLTDEFINALPSKQEQEAAHQKNRRTVFQVIRDDFVPPASEGSDSSEPEEE